MRRPLVLSTTSAALAVFLALAGCSKPQAPVAEAASAPLANAAPPVPDVGKLETRKVTATGFGGSAAEAVSDAMKLAILEVNGASIDQSSVSARYGLDVTLNQDSASLRANAFAEVVRQHSGGVIQNFRVLDLSEPADKAGRFKAVIEAAISKFTTPESLKKIRLVIAPLVFDAASLPMGDRSVPAAEVAATVRQRIVDAFVNTGRFAVLDRDFSPDVQQELDMISSGRAPSAETAKLGQAVSADLVWSGHVNALAYDRHARKLQTSDRELVSYSGGWALAQQLVNVATRQVTLSDSLHGEAPSTEPTTLGSGVDSNKVLAGMTDDLVSQIVASVLSRTFPVSVVSRDGTNVILSQGGQAARQGARYAVVSFGQELKDPQTGQSLGRADSPCCEVVVDRVTPNLSYGHLEHVNIKLDALPVGSLQVREELKPVAAPAAEADPAAPETPAAPVPAAARKPASRTVPTAPAEPAEPADKKW